jgi:uncharacterized YigZ family protein
MSNRFTTVRREGRFEFFDRGSRFIGICRPIASADEAAAFLEDVRVSYPEATHYVYAWRIDRPVQLQRFSDDGEPQGTAGRQALEVILREGIDRVAIVVVRYYGGVKLGTGGLTRAYSQGARGALLDAQPVEYIRCQTFSVETDYAVYHQLSGRLEASGYFQQIPEFGASVLWVVGATDDRVASLHEMIMNYSSGEAVWKPAGEKWLESTEIATNPFP